MNTICRYSISNKYCLDNVQNDVDISKVLLFKIYIIYIALLRDVMPCDKLMVNCLSHLQLIVIN